MNILRLSPDQSVKSGITDYAIIFDRILTQERIQITKPKYFLACRSTWWLFIDFLIRRKYWKDLLDNVDAVHAEVGVHQAKEILTLYYLLNKKKDLKAFITIHDPGVATYRIFRLYYNTTGSFISKVIAKIADKVELYINRFFFNSILNYILEQSIAVFVFNRWGLQKLLFKNAKIKKKIWIINHPIFDFHKQRLNQIKGRKIIYAGFWSENKGIEILIRAYALLRKNTNGVPDLVISGDVEIPNSSYSKKIRELVKSLGLRDFVIFPGFVSNEKMFKLLSEAFLVLPYNNKISGSASGIYIRGLQAGAVTIIADNQTLSSFAGNHRISLMFKQDSEMDLSVKLGKVLKDERLAYCLAKNGQDFVYNYGDWNRLGKMIVELYKKKIYKE